LHKGKISLGQGNFLSDGICDNQVIDNGTLIKRNLGQIKKFRVREKISLALNI